MSTTERNLFVYENNKTVNIKNRLKQNDVVLLKKKHKQQRKKQDVKRKN
jgi:hypothetical protein